MTNWDRFREPDMDSEWRGDDEAETIEPTSARFDPDAYCEAVVALSIANGTSEGARRIDRHRERIEWASRAGHSPSVDA